MKNNSKQAIERLKKVIMQDKLNSYEGFFRVLKGDMYSVFDCYMTMVGDIDIDCEMIEDGNFRIDISVVASHLKSPKTIC